MGFNSLRRLLEICRSAICTAAYDARWPRPRRLNYGLGNAMETCANCNASIGNLETPMVWNGAVVCAPCWNKLQSHSKGSPGKPKLQLFHKTENGTLRLGVIGVLILASLFFYIAAGYFLYWQYNETSLSSADSLHVIAYQVLDSQKGAVAGISIFFGTVLLGLCALVA